MSEHSPIQIVLIGYTGNVGSALLERIAALPAALQPRFAGVANSRAAYRFEQPVLVADLEHSIAQSKPTSLTDVLRFDAPTSYSDVVHRHEPHQLRRHAMVDCTASEMISRSYVGLLRDGTNVVTPNKLAFSRSMYEFREIISAAREGGARIDFETAVAAALPLLEPLMRLVHSGDRITQIEGNLSGTLAHVFNRMQDDGVALSAAIAEAHGRGLTEPDPWTDLSGSDVAKKLLILTRIAGYAVEPEQVLVTPMLQRTIEQQTLMDFDAEWADRVQTAKQQGSRLVYRALFDGSSLRVETTSVSGNDPLALGRQRDNVIVLRSSLYNPEALIIRGPGAGAQLTANGVLMGLLRLQREVAHDQFDSLQ
jgi:bifunctional aspartokinase / homoserine dehydrogenase 1